MLTTLMLVLTLSSPVSVRMAADTTKAPPRPASAPSSGRGPATKPAPKPAGKPVGDPVLKRRRPPD
jgi:hypothetical protein